MILVTGSKGSMRLMSAVLVMDPAQSSVVVPVLWVVAIITVPVSYSSVDSGKCYSSRDCCSDWFTVCRMDFDIIP